MNSSPLGGILFMVFAGGIFVYSFFDGIVFFGCLIAFNALYLYRIHKMQVSEEERRLGKKARAIVALLGVIGIQVILWGHSFSVPTAQVNMERVEYVREMTSGFGRSIVLIGIAGFAFTFGLAKTIKENNPVNPPMVFRYLLAFCASVSASLLAVGFVTSYGVLIFSISRHTSLVFEVRAAFLPLLAAMTVMHFFMSRLRFQNGEVATVYLFGTPIYMVTEHGDLFVPPFSATLQLLTDLLDQLPIGFSVDFGVIREELVRKRRHSVVFEAEGNHKPTRLDGGGGDSPRGGRGGNTPLPKPNPPTPEVARRAPPQEPARDTGGIAKGGVPTTIPLMDSLAPLVQNFLIVKSGDEQRPKPAEPKPEVPARGVENGVPEAVPAEPSFDFDEGRGPSLHDVERLLGKFRSH